ncbi:hypothetical protein F4561_000672 [Lipingzhangella halophila]|uniref:Uncharacterized protein n=1 Tax=Lipingzhangella halophila TaxID=1783352 RepID=A0A7W7RD98_9ACTN|nr:hypothetical protein [Lipingzhangella halophila]MBB4929852.1 hypothetical protein [Lipingzhangella halophila]
MVDDVTIAIATAVAGKIAESVTRGGIDGVKALRRLLRDRFSDRPKAREALDAARDDDGEDADVVRTLAEHIDAVRAQDPEIERLFETLRPEFTSGRGDVHNTIVGDVSGTAIQARDIEGGLNIGR